MVFIGANQTKVTIEFASLLQQLGTRAQYLRISGNGRNALDFHIAFYWVSWQSRSRVSKPTWTVRPAASPTEGRGSCRPLCGTSASSIWMR